MRSGLLVMALLSGCVGPQVIERAEGRLTPRLTLEQAVMADGYRLPLRSWSGPGEPRIVLIGLHGFNDYSRAFEPLAGELAERGIRTYAVDQRGFGASAQPGRWHGSLTLARDLVTLVELVRTRHPKARLYVAGESMGGAVAMLASAQASLPIDGLVLIAPAVWSRDTMPWYQRLALDAAAGTLPWLKLTGEGLSVRPTDNDDLLRSLSADPLVIKATRVDALWGVTDLMDAARTAAPRLRPPVLLLYGERDEIIPRRAFVRLLRELPSDRSGIRLVLYRDGWHMLPRDRQGARVRTDILSWLTDPAGPIPSGEETPIEGVRPRVLRGERSTQRK
ncbi:alpha/beta hydrolase [Thiocystis violacea]|uniref:alpha/beta hydrolase n=1 Tax=Thiocystis violacea TaxID=13725 RepID=UPI001F5B2378|nr:alpha/beta hydrolase [Thiocystis violacea]